MALLPEVVAPPSDTPATRSKIPQVVGILACVFAPIGLLVSAALAFGFDEELAIYGLSRSDLGGFGAWMTGSLVLGLALFGLHLSGGILSIAYRRRAPLFMTFYAIFALALLVTDAVLSVALFPFDPGGAVWQDLVGPRLGVAILALPWPIVALVLMNVRSARASCTR